MRRPGPTEFARFYDTYVNAVPGADVLDTLAAAPDGLDALLASLDAAAETFAYADGKWTVREVLGHVIDAERVFAYRALHMARADGSSLPGMEENAWATASNAGERELADLLTEFRALRMANVAQFRSWSDEQLDRTGSASGNAFTVRSLVFIIAGHELHHRRVLRERYVQALGMQEAGA